MIRRLLGRTGLSVSPIGFGGFKIGRNQKAKYPAAYELPGEEAVGQLLNGILDLGINYIDTAPAYGLSEERIGRLLQARRPEFVLSTKVGETFSDGRSKYDFTADGLERLKTEALDVLFLHSDGRDLWIQNETDAVPILCDLKARGIVRAIGLSGKSVDGARRALEWADVLMVEYHLQDRSHEDLMAEAAGRGVGIVVKKGLASGHLPTHEAVRFVLANPQVSTLVVGGLSLAHFRENAQFAAG